MKIKNRLQQLIDRELRPTPFLDEIGMPKSDLSVVLNGHRLPRPGELKKLAAFAEITEAQAMDLLSARVNARIRALREGSTKE